MATNYTNNQNARTTEVARMQRQKEEQARREKDKLRLQLQEKKGFLISTTREISTKSDDAAKIDSRHQKIISEMRLLEAKLKNLIQRNSTLGLEKNRMQSEERAEQAAVAGKTQEELRVEQKEKELEKTISGLKSDASKAVAPTGSQTLSAIQAAEKENERQLAAVTTSTHTMEQASMREEQNIRKSEQDIEQLERQLEAKKADLKRFTDEKFKDDQALTKLRREHDTLEAKIRDLKTSEKDVVSKGSSKMAEIERQLAEAARTEISIKAETEKKKRELEEEKKAVTAKEQAIAQKSGESATVQQQITALQREFDAMKRESTELERNSAGLKQQLNVLLGNKNSLEAEIRKLEMQAR